MTHTWIIETDDTAASAWAAMAFSIPNGDGLIVTEVAALGGYQFTDRDASPILFKLLQKPGAKAPKP
jgi:hypothetical protein